jgi:hypothetical protein
MTKPFTPLGRKREEEIESVPAGNVTEWGLPVIRIAGTPPNMSTKFNRFMARWFW